MHYGSPDHVIQTELATRNSDVHLVGNVRGWGRKKLATLQPCDPQHQPSRLQRNQWTLGLRGDAGGGLYVEGHAPVYGTRGMLGAKEALGMPLHENLQLHQISILLKMYQDPQAAHQGTP